MNVLGNVSEHEHLSGAEKRRLPVIFGHPDVDARAHEHKGRHDREVPGM
jgi:hypothetical protein